MPGIYIHIPFCRQACHYCNFHFSVSQKRRPEFIQALVQEIEMQKDFLKERSSSTPALKTLYLGGGTPSLLSIGELEQIVNALHKYFAVSASTEFTLEANPDDLTAEKLEGLRQLSVNRLSIGIQSFHDADLRYMNRSHSSRQAVEVLKNAQNAGFENITADLIYGTPGMSDHQWRENIMQLIAYGIPHISAYSLTVEKKTALEVFIRKGKAAAVDEEQSARQFEILCEITGKHGYEQYEISNFGKPGFFSKHNLSYWTGQPYLGMGPSAHSYKQGMRQWNIANTCTYIDEISQGNIPCQKEVLSVDQQYNEYVMTALRTQWGIEKSFINTEFGQMYYQNMIQSAQKHIFNQTLKETDTHLVITQSGKFLADGIAADLFI